MIPIRLRAAVEADINFILNSWLKSYRNSPAVRDVPNSFYFNGQHILIESLLKECPVLITCSPEDDNQIFGYCCAGHVEGVLTVHFCYVKEAFRGFGIATQLISSFERSPGAAGCYTHFTKAGEALAVKLDLLYNPFLLYYQKTETK